jgi:hypothetical protein
MAALYEAKCASWGQNGWMGLGLPKHILLMESSIQSTDESFKRRRTEDLKSSGRLYLMNFPRASEVQIAMQIA